MTMGLGVVGAVYTNGSDALRLRHDADRPAHRGAGGPWCPADSPFKTVDDFVKAWQDDPGGVTIGGGSTTGGPDHLFPMQLAEAVDVDPREVNYVPYDGGGPLTSALLGEKIDVGTSGLAEFEGQIEDGSLRVLATSGEEQSEIVDAPTLSDEGIDLVFTNWRGVLAPPDISDENRDYLIELYTEMHDTDAWREQLETTAGPTTSPPATSSARSSRSRTSASPTPSRNWGWHDHHPPPTAGTAPRGHAARRQGAVRPRGFLVVVGGYVFSTPPPSRRASPTSRCSRTRFPTSSAPPCRARRAARRRHRARRPARDRGGRGRRDRRHHRLAHRRDARRRHGRSTCCSIDLLGWAITGALLFAGAACVLGSRTPVRDVAIGAALSVGTWYGLYSRARHPDPRRHPGRSPLMDLAARRLPDRLHPREPALRRCSA